MGVWDLRALNSGEITKLEADGQSSRFGLAILPVRIVFQATVSTAPSSDDRVAQVSYTGGVGSYTDVLPDMTVFVGSSSGSYDKGMCRARKAATSSILYLGETSDIDWQVGDHLTVIEDWAIWGKHLRIVGSGDDFVVYMDWDVAYSDQHANCDPVPIMGPHIVVELTGASVDVDDFDASDSWVRGSTISTYAWVAPGASGTSGMSTANPTITYNAAGWYRVSCTLTATNGKSFVGHRWVYVYDDAHPPLWVEEIGSCEGSYQSGGWLFRVTGRYDVGLGDVRNRALAILFAEDTYAGDAGSVGIVAGRENILAMGWINGESITWDAVHGLVEFEAQGPQWWIDKVTGFPTGVEDVNAAASNWMEWQGLDVDDACFHFLHWRSTVTRMMDVSLPGSSMAIGMFNSGMSTLWSQLLEACDRTIRARPCCDKFGRLFIQVDSQFIPTGDRTGIPVILDIGKAHWREAVQIRRAVVGDVGRIDLSGVIWSNATLSGTAVCSLAPGHVPKWFGSVEAVDHLAVSSQSQANLLAGLILGNRNNPYPSLTVPFGMNVRAWDICPRQYGEITIAAGDTPRGIALTDFKLVPRRVVFGPTIAEHGSWMVVDVDFEGYTSEETSCDGDIPETPPAPPAPPGPPDPPPPPEPPPDALDYPDVVFRRIGTSAIHKTEDFQSADPTWADWTSTLTAIQRIAIDQYGLYVYAQCTSGLWRADLTALTATWSKVFDPASLPAGVDHWINTGMQVDSNGNICMFGVAADACASCSTGKNRPVMLIVKPGGAVEALHSQYGCSGGNCCPYHSYASYFNDLHVAAYHTGIHGGTFTIVGDCRGGMTGGASHFCRGSAGGGSYTMSDEDDPNSNWRAFHECLDLGTGSLYGRYSYDGKIYLVAPGSSSWQDVTPTGWSDGSAQGFDRDLGATFGLLADGDHLWSCTGGAFSLIQDRTALSPTPTQFRHCSGYYDDTDQLFLAAESYLLYSTDGGSTWVDKKGTAPMGGAVYEIRPVWSWTPGV